MEYPDQIGGQSVDLDTTGLRFAVRDNLCAMAESHRMSVEDTARYVVSAALMLCWPGARNKRGTPVYRNDLMAYGAEVWDFLRGPPVNARPHEIVQAGNAAMQMLLDEAVRLEDLVEAQGNSSTGSVGSTSGSASPSSAGGTGSQGGSPPWT